jgi:hypothetical protein
MPMRKGIPMDEGRKKVAKMQDLINRGEYRVEPVAVAEAIVRRLQELSVARAERVSPADRAWAAAHRECS